MRSCGREHWRSSTAVHMRVDLTVPLDDEAAALLAKLVEDHGRPAGTPPRRKPEPDAD